MWPVAITFTERPSGAVEKQTAVTVDEGITLPISVAFIENRLSSDSVTNAISPRVSLIAA